MTKPKKNNERKKEKIPERHREDAKSTILKHYSDRKFANPCLINDRASIIGESSFSFILTSVVYCII